MKIYNEFADWFHLLTHPSDYAGEAADYVRTIRAACPGAVTLLELGAGGGNNAFHMKRAFTCTLTDLSPGMLRLSQSINPECEYIVGDMRTLRLGRLFDAVFVHDAVEYMTTIDDLSQVAATAFTHTRPGGVSLFVPDGTKETFRESVDDGGHDGADGRGLRYLEWTMDPDPSDDRYEVHFACLLRSGDHVQVVHDRHEHGLFTRQQWLDVLTSAGFLVSTPPLAPETHELQVAFLARRPERSLGFAFLGLRGFAAAWAMWRRHMPSLALISLLSGLAVVLGFSGGMVLPVGILGIRFAVVVGWAWLAVMSMRLSRLA